jgi:hypothetical protein
MSKVFEEKRPKKIHKHDCVQEKIPALPHAVAFELGRID